MVVLLTVGRARGSRNLILGLSLGVGRWRTFLLEVCLDDLVGLLELERDLDPWPRARVIIVGRVSLEFGHFVKLAISLTVSSDALCGRRRAHDGQKKKRQELARILLQFLDRLSTRSHTHRHEKYPK